MPVVCSNCGAINRDNAKFCRGCLAKLPGFAATGASMLETLPRARIEERRNAPDAPASMRGYWIRLGLLALLAGIGLVAWYAYVTRRVPPPAVPVPSVPAASSTSAPTPPAAPASAPAAVLEPGASCPGQGGEASAGAGLISCTKCALGAGSRDADPTRCDRTGRPERFARRSLENAQALQRC